MKQKYTDLLDHDKAVMSVMENMDHRRQRSDNTLIIAKYSGISWSEMMHQMAHDVTDYQTEAANAIALELEQRIENYLESGDLEDLDVDPVQLRPRIDGLSGKTRNICKMDSMHQMLGHIVFHAIRPMLRQKLLPWQHASVPGHGQTRLKTQTHRILRRDDGIRYAIKADVYHAYESTTYEAVLELLRRDLPSATQIHAMVKALGRLAPGGHLIIGGYLDAWLFNYVMAHAIRHLLSLRKVRRKKDVALVKYIQNYMDDTALFGGRLADLKSALRQTGRWMEPLGLKWKDAVEIVAFLPLREEHARKHAPTPGGRGCPGLDMGGYVIHRSYVTIRPRIWRVVRRAWLRGARKRPKGIPIQLARRMMAYYGPIKQSDSRIIKRKYSVMKLKQPAAAAVSWATREQARKRKERLMKYA